MTKVVTAIHTILDWIGLLESCAWVRQVKADTPGFVRPSQRGAPRASYIPTDAIIPVTERRCFNFNFSTEKDSRDQARKV